MTAIDAVATQTLACLRVLPLTGDSIHTGLLAENRQERPLLGRSEPFQFFTGATAPVIEQCGREGSTALRAPKQRAKVSDPYEGQADFLGPVFARHGYVFLYLAAGASGYPQTKAPAPSIS